MSFSNHSFNLSTDSSKTTAHAWFAFSITTSLGGAIVLLLLLASSFHDKALHRGSRILLIHLMTMQLLICGVFYPVQSITTYRAMLQQHPKLNCPPLQLLHIGTMYAVNWASALLAVNRFVAIELPLAYRTWVSRKVLVFMITVPWMIGLGSTLPAYLGEGAYFVFLPEYGLCSPRATVNSSGVYGVVWVAVGAYTPVMCEGVIYVLLFIRLAIKRRVFRTRLTVAAHVPVLVPTVGARQMAITKMLVVVFAWYCVCFLPSPIILTTYPSLFARNTMLQLWISKSLVLCGYAASPIIFLALSSDYQRGVHRLLTCLRTGRAPRIEVEAYVE